VHRYCREKQEDRCTNLERPGISIEKSDKKEKTE